MVQLKSLLSEGNLFTEIVNINPFPFIVDNEEALQQLLLINYGERTVWLPYENMTLEHIARTLVLNHSVSWNSYLKIDEILDTPFNEIEVDETSTSEETKSGSNNQVNKVSAFNESSLVDDDGSESNSNDESESTRNKLYKRLDKNKKVAYDMLKDSDMNSIIQKVLTDVANSLTHTIY